MKCRPLFYAQKLDQHLSQTQTESCYILWPEVAENGVEKLRRAMGKCGGQHLAIFGILGFQGSRSPMSVRHKVTDAANDRRGRKK